MAAYGLRSTQTAVVKPLEAKTASSSATATHANDNSAQRLTLATKVRWKTAAIGTVIATATATTSRKTRTIKITLPLSQLLWLLCCLCAIHAMADCPSVCECKWKNGKESVLCLNANLTHIPAPLDTGTQVLDLTGNEIVQIPNDTFAAVQLLNLQKVYLAKCRLRSIERFALRKLINLVELDLSYNQLTIIPSEALEFVPELRELKLNGNPIYRVHNDAFIKLPQMVRLELTDCRLTVVDMRAFAGLESSLEWLKLDGNKLSVIRSGTITSLTNLHGIELARNQWNCSCALRPLRAWMLQQNVPCGVPPICSAPERLADKPWDKIELDEFACVPQIIATDTTAYGVEGRNVTMSCYVEGVPEPSVRWLVKNRVIANLSGKGEPTTNPLTAAATQGRKTYVLNMLRNASNLTILTADMQDAGIYTCAAENKAGKVEASVTLAVSRRPPEAPLGVKLVLLCVFAALVFVLGSSFAAICFCSLRRKRKLRLWNSVSAARTESYEKIEMTARVSGVGKPDLGGGASCGSGSGTCAGIYHDDDDMHNSYLRSTTTPLNCGSDDGGGVGATDSSMAIVNPSSAGVGVGCGTNSVKRNGDYLHVSTHCDDDGTGYEDNDLIHPQQHQHPDKVQHQQQQGSRKPSFSVIPTVAGNDNGDSEGLSTYYSTRTTTTTTTTTEATVTTAATVTGRWSKLDDSVGVSALIPQDIKNKVNASATNNSNLEQETDLHIPRLIDIRSADSTSCSISSQVDAAVRLATDSVGYGNSSSITWKATQKATTKIASPHSKQHSSHLINDDVTTSVFCSNNGTEPDLFDNNYPDLLDVAKYTVAQVTNHTNMNANSGLCTLPRKLKNTGKYFKSSSDSQSPLLADNSSKYGSSMLGDGSFLNDAVGLGRRYSAESSYSNFATSATYSNGQRSSSFLNLVQSAHKGGLGPLGIGGGYGLNIKSNAIAASVTASVNGRQIPSLHSSPAHESQKHQRSFSSAATPLLDFSALTTRATGIPINTSGGHNLNSNTAATSSVAAYDYHTAQLEHFLEEYRNLQDQLCKMKETCDTIRKKETPLSISVGQSAQLADPVMFNAALTANSNAAHSPKPPTTLKTKALLPGQPPDPPPYWLHRHAMLKRLNDAVAAVNTEATVVPGTAAATTGFGGHVDIFKS